MNSGLSYIQVQRTDDNNFTHLRTHRSGNKFSSTETVLTRDTVVYRSETHVARRTRKPLYSKKQINKNRRSAWPPIFHKPRPVPRDLQSDAALLLNLRRAVPVFPLDNNL